MTRRGGIGGQRAVGGQPGKSKASVLQVAGGSRAGRASGRVVGRPTWAGIRRTMRVLDRGDEAQTAAGREGGEVLIGLQSAHLPLNVDDHIRAGRREGRKVGIMSSSSPTNHMIELLCLRMRVSSGTRSSLHTHGCSFKPCKVPASGKDTADNKAPSRHLGFSPPT